MPGIHRLYTGVVLIENQRNSTSENISDPQQKKDAMKSQIAPTLLIAITLAFITTGTVWSESADCRYERKVKADKNYTIEIENKFGTVTLVNTKGDSLKACATVTIIHPGGTEMIRKSMELVSVDITEDDKGLKFITRFDQKFFTKSFSAGRESFSVNYVVEIPEAVNVTIKNSYGNVFIPTLSGYTQLTVTNGEIEIDNLKRGNVKPINNIELVNAKARIDKLNWATLSAKYTDECIIEEAEAIAFKSVLSNFTLIKVGNIAFGSKLGLISIGKAGKINGESDMTKITIEMLEKGGQITTNMGELNITSMGDNIKDLTIASNYSAVSLGLPKEGNPYVTASISAGPLKNGIFSFSAYQGET